MKLTLMLTLGLAALGGTPGLAVCKETLDRQLIATFGAERARSPAAAALKADVARATSGKLATILLGCSYESGW